MSALQTSIKIGKVRISHGAPKVTDQHYVVDMSLYPGAELTLIPGTRDYFQILLNEKVVYNISEEMANIDALVDDMEIVRPGVVRVLRKKPINVRVRIPNRHFIMIPMYPFVTAAYLFVLLLMICNFPSRILGPVTQLT